MHVSPGSCSQTQANFDYDHTKAVIINLRSNSIEKCFDITYIGCGDGVFDPSAGQECNDGNRMSSDGCSQSCKIETGFICNSVVGQKSVCTNIYCGNGQVDPGEECDNGGLGTTNGCNNDCTL
jgi:cysteine-rich repeat protein